MRHLRQWTAVALAVGVCGWGYACKKSEDPSAQEREVRSEVLRGLLSREAAPRPEGLEAQRRDLRAELGQGEAPGQGGSGQQVPTAQVTGKVEWVGDDELLFWDEQGAEREVRVEPGTRFLEKGREVSRRAVAAGAEIRVAYEEQQGEWIAREVVVLQPAPPLPPGEGGGEGSMSPPPQR